MSATSGPWKVVKVHRCSVPDRWAYCDVVGPEPGDRIRVDAWNEGCADKVKQRAEAIAALLNEISVHGPRGG